MSLNVIMGKIGVDFMVKKRMFKINYNGEIRIGEFDEIIFKDDKMKIISAYGTVNVELLKPELSDKVAEKIVEYIDSEKTVDFSKLQQIYNFMKEE